MLVGLDLPSVGEGNESVETSCSLDPVLYCLSRVDQRMPSSLPSFSFTETDDLCMEKGMKHICQYKGNYQL